MTVAAFCRNVGINRTNYYKFAGEGMPETPDVEGGKKWVYENKSQRKLGPPETSRRKGSIAPLDDNDTWEGRLVRARQTERETHKAYLDALASDSKTVERLLVCHARSVQAVGEAEEIARKIQKDSGEIATRDEFRVIMATVLTPLRQALDGLPVNEATRCNPEMPDVARRVLEEWRDGLLVRLSGLEKKL